MLNREPMGMKHEQPSESFTPLFCFSAQPRADGDEAETSALGRALAFLFQCSTASRWG